MPVHTLDASAYTGLKRALTVSQTSAVLSPLKTRAPLMYGSYYRPLYTANIIQPGITPIYDPVVAILDFTTTFSGSDPGSKYVVYDLPNATRSVTFTYTNLSSIDGNAYPEIDSATFDFQTDASQIIFKGSPVTEKYDTAFFSTFGIYQNDVNLVNNNVLQLTTTSPISGRLFVGFYVTSP